MKFQTKLISGRLIKRYKRFLADVRLDNGEVITAHCPNTGSMAGLASSGIKVWLEPNTDPKKKLNYAWRLVEHDNGHLTGIDTNAANKIVSEALHRNKIKSLSGFETIRSEQKYGLNSRIDFLLSSGSKRCFVEVKSVTLCRENGLAEFPDANTTRGIKHLAELASVVNQDTRAVMLYLIQRTDCTGFKIAQDIDPDYAKAANSARSMGVDFLCFDCEMSEQEITLNCAVKIIE